MLILQIANGMGHPRSEKMMRGRYALIDEMSIATPFSQQPVCLQ